MIDVYQKQVFETRETLCKVTHNDRLLLESNKFFKDEISEFRKTTTALKKAGITPRDLSTSKLWQLVCTSQPNFLLMQLRWLASDAIVSDLALRLEPMKYTGEINFKRLRRDEQKYQRLLEREVAFMEPSTQMRFITFTNKIGDYKGSLSTAHAARKLGEAAHGHLRLLSNHLKEITYWGNGEEDRPAAGDYYANALLERVFNSAMNAVIHLCAFKTEVSEFRQSRDLHLHFQAVLHFKSSFLIV